MNERYFKGFKTIYMTIWLEGLQQHFGNKWPVFQAYNTHHFNQIYKAKRNIELSRT